MTRLRPLARRDVRSIAAYLDEQSLSPSLRHRFLVSFEETCLLLERSPGIGSPVRHAETHPPLRKLPIRQFPRILIFYRQVKSSIIVERVLHGARDLAATLDEYPDA